MNIIDEAHKTKTRQKSILRLGVSGDVGSFSEEAGIIYAQKNHFVISLKYLMDMEGVLNAVEAGRVDLGIFPVVNLYGGLVRMAFEAMGRHHFKVIDELWLNVNQCLIAKPNLNKTHIQKIVSHSQALKQCKLYVEKNFPQAELSEFQDTAKAARELSEGKLSSTTAVIASARAADVYGLELLAGDIQDENPNMTAFIVVKKN